MAQPATPSKQKNETTDEEAVYKPGETVEYSGEYELVDAQGNKTDYDIITLEEGDTFPENLKDTNLCYRMLATCVDEQCDVNVADEELSD